MNAVNMKVDFSGTADDVLRRLTLPQLQEGIRRAERGMTFCRMMVDNPGDAWEHPEQQFAGNRAPSHHSEQIAHGLIEANLLPHYEAAHRELTAELSRRGAQC